MPLMTCCIEPSQREGFICDVLVLGLESAGKSLLIRRLQSLHSAERPGPISADTVATVGTELHEVFTGKLSGPVKRIIVREVGGSMVPLWPQYYPDAQCLVFVVDCTAHAQLAPAQVELYELLSEPELREVTVAVVLSKIDLPGALSRVEVDMVLQLRDLKKMMQDRLTVLEVSAWDGTNVPDLLEWMIRKKTTRLMSVSV